MFITGLVTETKTGKLVRCPSTDKRVRKTGHVNTMGVFFSGKEHNCAVFRKVSATGDHHVAQNKLDSDKAHISLIQGC